MQEGAKGSRATYTQLIMSSNLETLCRWKPLGDSSGMCRVWVEPARQRLLRDRPEERPLRPTRALPAALPWRGATPSCLPCSNAPTLLPLQKAACENWGWVGLLAQWQQEPGHATQNRAKRRAGQSRSAWTTSAKQ